jgi:hypothetical protein
MPEEEILLMPTNYIKKFNSFVIKLDDSQAIEHLRLNKELSGYE